MVPVASTPSIITRPPVGSMSPAMMLKMVLLPQPDGPIRLTKRPRGIDKVTGASAWNDPVGVGNAMLTWSTRSFGACIHTPVNCVKGTTDRGHYIARPVPAAMGWMDAGATCGGAGRLGNGAQELCPRSSRAPAL